MAIVNQERVLALAEGAAVIVLLVLAFLQYRWSRQVGAAVGEHIGATLKASMLDWPRSTAVTIRVPHFGVTCFVKRLCPE